MFVQALCLDAVTICPHFVRMLTILSFFIWYVEKIYLWNLYVISKIIKLFWFDSVEAESIFWQPKNFISQFVLSICLSVCLSVRLFVCPSVCPSVFPHKWNSFLQKFRIVQNSSAGNRTLTCKFSAGSMALKTLNQ